MDVLVSNTARPLSSICPRTFHRVFVTIVSVSLSGSLHRQLRMSVHWGHSPTLVAFRQPAMTLEASTECWIHPAAGRSFFRALSTTVAYSMQPGRSPMVMTSNLLYPEFKKQKPKHILLRVSKQATCGKIQMRKTSVTPPRESPVQWTRCSNNNVGLVGRIFSKSTK